MSGNLQKPAAAVMKPHPSNITSQQFHVSRVMSPSRVNRPCSPNPCRKTSLTSTENKDEPGKILRWRGGGMRGGGTRGGLQSQSRIPKIPGAKGKENIRGRVGTMGKARIAKPVVAVTKSKIATKKQKELIEAQDLLIDIATQDKSLSNSFPPPKPKSPIPIGVTSKLVPDLHQKILEKIRINKRRSLQRSFQTNQSPCKAPAPCLQSPEHDQSHHSHHDNSQELDRDSPVSGQDLETYLSSVFNLVDTYR